METFSNVQHIILSRHDLAPKRQKYVSNTNSTDFIISF
jgi:hypothetical protein